MKASLRIVLLVVLTLGASSWLEAALSRQNNVLGRFTVVSVTGTATCVSDGRILELKKGDTIRARGATLETAPGSKVSILFSNQTSTVLDEKTRFEIVKFDQEFFAPNNNLRVEPSNSSTIIKLATGRVVLSTPRLLSGTTMVYETAHAMVGIRGERVLIEAEEKQTHVAMINGTATVNPRAPDGSFVSIGKRLTTGQEAFVKYTIGGAAITEEEFVASKENAVAKSAADVPATASIAPGAALPIPTAVATGELTRETEAIVLRLTGPATVKLPNNNVSRAIAEGESVPAGAVLSTNDSAELYLQTFEGTIATLRPKTTVRIEKLSVVTEGGVVKKQSTLLGLQAGTLVSTIDPAKSGLNDYGVRTPKGIASAKGTSFSVSVEEDGFLVATTADTVVFTTPNGTNYSIAAGNVTITSPGGEPQPPISLASAVASSSSFAGVVQTALDAVTHVVQNNLGALPPSSAADLITKVAQTAAAALPAEAGAIASKAVVALTSPLASTSTIAGPTVSSLLTAVVSTAPDQASQIATSAAIAAPAHAIAIAAGAAKAAPAQSAQIASAVTQTFVQTTPQGTPTPGTVQTAAALASAVAASVPAQAAPVAAAVMQALAQASPQSPPTANSQIAATIASAVTTAAPTQAVPIAATMMKVLTLTPTMADASPQVVAQTAATLAAAVTVVVPPQAQEVATAVMQLLVQSYPNASPAITTQTAGVLAAAVAQAAPASAAAITQSVALAANQPLVSVQAAAAQAGPVVAQISQQVAQATQNAASAGQLANAATNPGPASPPPSSFAGGIGSPGATGANPAAPAGGGSGGAATGDPEQNTSTPIIVTQFDPADLGELEADLDAAQAAQTSVQFSSGTTGGGPGGTGTPIGGGNPGNNGDPGPQPRPTVPDIPPVEYTGSQANLVR